MGARAHYIRRSAGVWQLRYSHWGAETIDRDIFWGPAHTRAFVDAQVEREQDDWLDENWCEGAVLMDEDNRELWYFGGVTSDVLSARVYDALLRVTWGGWDVHRSTLADIADALDVDRGWVQNAYEPEPIAANWSMTSGNVAWTVVTLARNATVDAFAVEELLPDLVGLGPDRLLAAGAGTTVTLDSPNYAGLHLDSDRKAVYWWPGPRDLLAHMFASTWPGWTAESLGDRFETHVELARGAFTVRTPPRNEIVAKLREHLLAETATDPSDIRARFEAKFGQVQFANDFATPIPVRPSPTERTRIVDTAIASTAVLGDPPE